MLKLDWNLLWTVVNLIILFLLMKKFLFGPVCKMMDERSQKIQRDLDGAANAKQEAEKIKTEYEAEIAGAHKQAAQITEAAKISAGKQGDIIIENAKQEAAGIISEAEKSISNERVKVLDDAKYQIADLALLAAARVIKKNVGSDSDKKAAEDFLSEVGASK